MPGATARFRFKHAWRTKFWMPSQTIAKMDDLVVVLNLLVFRGVGCMILEPLGPIIQYLLA